MLKKLTTNLIVDDVNATINWYQDVLSCFEVVVTDPDKGKLDWALMSCEDVDIMFQSRDSIAKSFGEFLNKEDSGSIVIYIEMEYLKGFRKMIKNKVEVIKDIHTTPYGIQEFAIRDCNGFILVFAEW
jgi:uncharacterized glyoxalase superfamily protein PhnB